MKKLITLLFTLSLSMLLFSAVNVSAQTPSANSKITSLISSIVTKYPQSSRAYSLIEIGKTQYLIKGNSAKIIRTKRISSGAGGMCGTYAAVRMVAATAQMKEQSEGEGSIWKFDGQNWQEIAQTAAGDWSCKDVRGIPKQVRKCLGADECF